MSKITFQCSCGRTINVAAEHAGKKAKCPQCAQPVLIPVLLMEEEEEIGLAIEPDGVAPVAQPVQPARATPITAQPVRATATAPVRAVPTAAPVQTQAAKPVARPAATSAAPAISLPPLIESAQENAPSAWDLADEPLPELTSENLLTPLMPLPQNSLGAAIEPLPPLSSLSESETASASPYSNYSPPQSMTRSSGNGAWKDFMWIPCSVVICAVLTLIMQSGSTSFGRSSLATNRTSPFGGSSSFNSPPTSSPAVPPPGANPSGMKTRTLNQPTRIPGAGQNLNQAPGDNGVNVARQAIERDWSRDPAVRTIVSLYTSIDPLTQSKINREFGNGAGAHWEKRSVEKVVQIYRELECLTTLSKLVKSKDDLESLKKAIEHAKNFDFHSKSAGQTDHELQEFAEKVTGNPLYAKFVLTVIAPKLQDAETKFKEAFAQLEKDYGEDAAPVIAGLPYLLKDDPSLVLIDDVVKNIPADIATKQVADGAPKSLREADITNPAKMFEEARKTQRKAQLEHSKFWDKRSMDWDHWDCYKMFENCYANAMYVDSENFDKQVFWAKGLKQPAMFLRIGMIIVERNNLAPTVPPPGGSRFPSITRDLGERDLDTNYDNMTKVAGNIPEQIAASILDRERRGSCGEWGRNLKEPSYFAKPGVFALRTSTGEEEAIDSAQRIRLDNLIELIITKKDPKATSATMQFKLIDVRTRKELYVQTKPMSSAAITGSGGKTLVQKELGELFKYIDENLLLENMAPKLEALKKVKAEHPEIITNRIQKLLDEKEPYEPLALLVEARYYLEHELATKEELAPVFEKVLGRIKSQNFLNGDLDTRHEIMKEFIKD